MTREAVCFAYIAASSLGSSTELSPSNSGAIPPSRTCFTVSAGGSSSITRGLASSACTLGAPSVHVARPSASSAASTTGVGPRAESSILSDRAEIEISARSVWHRLVAR
eukprot:scaffold265113_cov32-Tisochrysis_lutea.AAC.2